MNDIEFIREVEMLREKGFTSGIIEYVLNLPTGSLETTFAKMIEKEKNMVAKFSIFLVENGFSVDEIASLIKELQE